MADLSLLDQSVAKLIEDIADLPVEDLAVLLAAENAGKTRKGAVAALEDQIAQRSAPAAPVCHFHGIETVENVTSTTTVHVGDGRRILPGESLELPAEIAAVLVAGGCCK